MSIINKSQKSEFLNNTKGKNNEERKAVSSLSI